MLRESLNGHTLVEASTATADVLLPGTADSALAGADVALGQPAVAQLMGPSRLRWVHLSTAGYTVYDRADLRAALQARGVPLSTSSDVFADPCAQHVLAMMLARARRLPESMRDQLNTRGWDYEQRRFDSVLLTGQSVLILGFGSIGRRLAALLAPFGMDVAAVRRTPSGEEGVRIVSPQDLGAALGAADHVVNLLPDNEGTRGFFDATKFAAMKPGACFYNVGRGTTVDQAALIAALESAHLGCACLDVTNPEPLPPDHPLWRAPNCIITPHTAGGRSDQDEALVRHFLKNLARLERGEPLANRVI
ncbi:MAG TPA: D-2-hydroxyacid dehydrogenase [Burkholderiales bacterium]|nr:D-2-hydroxyacid dehydrogenase [Burkholderiales bacterium]